MVNISVFIHLAEACEKSVSDIYSFLKDFHSLNLVLVYVLLGFTLFALSQSYRKVEVTHVIKKLSPGQQETIKQQIKTQVNDLKAQVELIRSKLSLGQTSDVLAKINAAYSELENIQSFHNQFKEEIIDSHVKIIEILTGKAENTTARPPESNKPESLVKSSAAELKYQAKIIEKPLESQEVQNKTRKNSENSEEKVKKSHQEADSHKTPPKEEVKFEEKKDLKPVEPKEDLKPEPARPKIFTPRPAPVSIPRQPPPIRGKVGVNPPTDRAKYSAPAVKSSPFG